MACRVGEGNNGLEEVTFLYRLTPGTCPKSYGVNVARLAGKACLFYFIIIIFCLFPLEICTVHLFFFNRMP